MLARKYDNYAWEVEHEEQVQVQEPIRRADQRAVDDPYRVARHRAFCVVAVVLAVYFISVVRSEAMVQHGNTLVSLRHQESMLINKNNELKIEVEQLKGPERIIGLAEQNLGMSVARSNIYVNAVNVKK